MPPHLRLAEEPGPVGRLAEEPGPLGEVPSVKESISVVLADEHHGVRRSIRALLDGEDGLEVVAEAEDLEAVVRELAAHCPHVLVLDLGITDWDGARTGGIATIVSLRAQTPGTEIVAVTVNDAPAFARAALDAGAAAFVLKDLAASDLPRAIRAAAGGHRYVTPRVGERLAASQRGTLRAGRAGPEQGGRELGGDGGRSNSGRGSPKNMSPRISPWMTNLGMGVRGEA
jgi:DNA-binding NarL/FixJ family response regulator